MEKRGQETGVDKQRRGTTHGGKDNKGVGGAKGGRGAKRGGKRGREDAPQLTTGGRKRSRQAMASVMATTRWGRSRPLYQIIVDPHG